MPKKTPPWQCPICKCKAYQKHGTIPLPAIRTRSGKGGKTIEEDTTVKWGTHFMCKGCSVFFSNPNAFNAVAVAAKIMKDLADQCIEHPPVIRIFPDSLPSIKIPLGETLSLEPMSLSEPLILQEIPNITHEEI